MPYYEFQDCGNAQCPTRNGEVGHVFQILYAMKDAPRIGARIPCPRCGKGTIVRIASSGVGCVVRGTNTPTIHSGDTVRTRDADGRPLDITFVDHPHTDPNYQSGLAQAARRAGVGGMSKAYYSEKHGCHCVDVASNSPDPLGKLKKQQQAAGNTEVRHINQPVSRPKLSKRPRAKTPSYCPVRSGL